MAALLRQLMAEVPSEQLRARAAHILRQITDAHRVSRARDRIT
jgi:23S rRNA U2552 (ribose-2'-O)-methylase RlmE/FtsJ